MATIISQNEKELVLEVKLSGGMMEMEGATRLVRNSTANKE